MRMGACEFIATVCVFTIMENTAMTGLASICVV